MITYNKLIRDRIPEIINKTGKECRVVKLDNETYIKELKKKMIEEANELVEANELNDIMNELADILEITDSIIKYHGIDINKLNEVKAKKAQERGSFENKIFLINVSD